MKSPDQQTPGEVIASLPDSKIDLTDPAADLVTASGEHFTPVHALMIGVHGKHGVHREDGSSALVIDDGSVVVSRIGLDGKPTHISYQSPRRDV
jgi:hypothetical protein